ncbi:ADP-ribosylation factor-related protein 1-like isoform X2 [Oppia nitens]|uniref:ADP-ribosylation factor-related protein 1-like isoform X2 n=1 Tax=Oppia nitens TaxID=1686743 RepID=UPI0023DC0B3B|nr:ADP-ribosylation factor-related protein 1-like isoform X2 [Oppia nitens]
MFSLLYGKTTFLEQSKTQINQHYRGVPLNKITATVGLNIGHIHTNGLTLNFWDLGGQTELQTLWDKYYSESHAVIYVVDSSDTERLEDSKVAFDKMITNETLSGVPLLLVANKQDIPESLSLHRIKDIFFMSDELIGRREYYSVSASALNGNGVKESIEWTVAAIQRNAVNRPPLNSDE